MCNKEQGSYYFTMLIKYQTRQLPWALLRILVRFSDRPTVSHFTEHLTFFSGHRWQSRYHHYAVVRVQPNNTIDIFVVEVARPATVKLFDFFSQIGGSPLAIDVYQKLNTKIN